MKKKKKSEEMELAIKLKKDIKKLHERIAKIENDTGPVINNYRTVYELNKELFRAEFSRISSHVVDARYIINEHIKKIEKTLLLSEEQRKLRPEQALDTTTLQLHKDHSALTSLNESFKMILEYVKNLNEKIKVIEK
jgi:hypothetical protein